MFAVQVTPTGAGTVLDFDNARFTDGATTTFTHPQNVSPPTDVSGYYEWSSNLVDWYASGIGPGGGPAVTFVPVTVGSTATVTATTSEAMESLFLRAGAVQD